MSNKLAVKIVFVLAATALGGCATQKTEGLIISHNTSNSLAGSFARGGQQLSFDIARDEVCHTMEIRRADGSSALRMALCADRDTVDVDGIHAEGPAGSLLAGVPLTPVGMPSGEEVYRIVADPVFALIRDFSSELNQELGVDPELRLPSAPFQGGEPAPAGANPVCVAACSGWFVGCNVAAALMPFPANLVAWGVCTATYLGCAAACG